MPISLACHCGRALRVKDEAAGRKVRCPVCGTVLSVPQPEAPQGAEDEALNILLADSPAEDSPRRAEPPANDERIQEGTRRPPPAPTPAPRPSREREVERPRPRKASRKKSRERSGGGIAIHPQIIAGVGMMAGAAIWFFAGLAAGYIYFYPPVLFFLGIGAIIRGFTGSE